MDTETYLKLFLEADDLPGLHLEQDYRLRDADPYDEAFARCHGLRTGLNEWMGADISRLWRAVDVRWVFPTEKDAIAYHLATLQINSEGDPVVDGAPKAGADCYVFGGTISDQLFDMVIGEPGAASATTRFFYIFRVGRVVVKLYAAEGGQAASLGNRLTVQTMKGLTDRIISRIVSADQEFFGDGKNPWWRDWLS
jgi:hypothetical protein